MGNGHGSYFHTQSADAGKILMAAKYLGDASLWNVPWWKR
jgi:hypothetical protein